MTILAIFLTISAAIFSPLRDIFVKKSKDKQLFVWWMSFLSILMISPIAIHLIWQSPPSIYDITFILGTGLIHSLYWTFSSKAYDHGDISHVYPIIRGAPAIILLFAIFFLEEAVTVLGITGIFLITFGVYIINLKGIKLDNIFEPLKSIRSDIHTRWAILALFSLSIFAVLDKVGVSNIEPIVYAFLISISALSYFSVFILTTKDHKQLIIPWKKERKNLLFAALFSCINYTLVLYAVEMSKVSYVSGFKQISVVFAVILGGIFLKEKQTKIRLFAAILISTGAILIGLA